MGSHVQGNSLNKQTKVKPSIRWARQGIEKDVRLAQPFRQAGQESEQNQRWGRAVGPLRRYDFKSNTAISLITLIMHTCDNSQSRKLTIARSKPVSCDT